MKPKTVRSPVDRRYRPLNLEQLESRRLLSVVGLQSSRLLPVADDSVVQGQAFSAPALVDFDADGLMDLLVGEKTADGQGAIVFYRNLGNSEDPQFETGVPISDLLVEAQGCLGVSVAAADLDADGRTDLILGLSAGSVVWHRAEGIEASGIP